MSKAREKVLARSYELSLHDMFDGKTFHQVREEIDSLEKRVDYSVGETVRFRVEYGYEYTDVYMDIFRDETDKEYKKRLEKEEAAREKARIAREKRKERARQVLMETEASEREEYERLRAKFGE